MGDPACRVNDPVQSQMGFSVRNEYSLDRDLADGGAVMRRCTRVYNMRDRRYTVVPRR